jgi:protein-tyrosine-phosphatase
MATDRISLQQRAGRHAVLADPSRLAIVDLLTLGDASPAELAAHLGMGSNLIAHHLGQLERHSMITRMRSEGDRRRTYIQLRPGALDDLVPWPGLSAKRVVFVCTGNSARSQLAAALWHRTSGVPVTSAGTKPAEAVAPGAIATAKRHGLPLRARRPRHLDQVLTPQDYVITVCDAAHEELGAAGRLHWSVPDPVPVGTDDAFDAAFEDIARRIDGLSARLTGTP